MAKRYYWLRLRRDFFRDKYIKKLRRIAGGDTYTIIFLKMMLNSLETDGVITYEGLEESFAAELALELDEDIDNVQVTLNYLINTKLLVEFADDKYIIPLVRDNTGSECSSAKRVRDHREAKKLKALQCNTDVKKCNVETDRQTEKELEKELDRQTDIEIEEESDLLTKIKSVCQSRELSIDPVQIYEQIKQNNTKVKNLEKYLVSVDEYQKAEKKQSGSGTKFNDNFHQRDYDFDDLERQLLSSERGE
jgi:predicted phage replisome organizer